MDARGLWHRESNTELKLKPSRHDVAGEARLCHEPDASRRRHAQETTRRSTCRPAASQRALPRSCTSTGAFQALYTTVLGRPPSGPRAQSGARLLNPSDWPGWRCLEPWLSKRCRRRHLSGFGRGVLVAGPWMHHPPWLAAVLPPYAKEPSAPAVSRFGPAALAPDVAVRSATLLAV